MASTLVIDEASAADPRPTQAVPKNSVPNHAYPYTAVSFAVSVLCTTALYTGNAPNVRQMKQASPTPSLSESRWSGLYLAGQLSGAHAFCGKPGSPKPSPSTSVHGSHASPTRSRSRSSCPRRPCPARRRQSRRPRQRAIRQRVHHKDRVCGEALGRSPRADGKRSG